MKTMVALLTTIGTFVDPVFAYEPLNCGQGPVPMFLDTISLRAGSEVSQRDKDILLSAINCANGLISSIGIPEKFNMILSNQNSNLAYFPSFNELIATVQLLDPTNKSLKSKELTLATLIHEYGHVAFFHGLPWWEEYHAYADAELLIVEEREALRIKVKELEQKLQKENLPDLRNELETAQRQYEDSYTRLAKSVEAGQKFKRKLLPITGPYTELFSDLLAVVLFRDGKIMSKATNVDGQNDALDFTLQHDISMWDDKEAHRILSPSRSYLWKALQKIPDSEMPMFLRKVYDVMVLEIDRRYNESLTSLNPQEINVRLLEALASSSI